MPDPLNQEERLYLLKLARQALEQAVLGKALSPLDLESQPPCLQEMGVTFVTLTLNGELRGCVGALDAYQSLVEDVREHAVAAGFRDYRFPPLTREELSEVSIEISRLTPPRKIDYKDPLDLLKKLRPCIDGVIIRDGLRRATFLPQVWRKIPDPALFISLLCEKMGAPPDFWQCNPLEVWIYQVEEFHE